MDKTANIIRVVASVMIIIFGIILCLRVKQGIERIVENKNAQIENVLKGV